MKKTLLFALMLLNLSAFAQPFTFYERLMDTRDIMSYSTMRTSLLIDASQGLDYRNVSPEDFQRVKQSYCLSRERFNRYLNLLSDYIVNQSVLSETNLDRYDQISYALDSALLYYQIDFKEVFNAVKYKDGPTKALDHLLYTSQNPDEIEQLVLKRNLDLENEIDSLFRLPLLVPSWDEIVKYNPADKENPNNIRSRQTLIELVQKEGSDYDNRMRLDCIDFGKDIYTTRTIEGLQTEKAYPEGTYFQMRLNTELYAIVFAIHPENNSIEHIYPFNSQFVNTMKYTKDIRATAGNFYTFEPLDDIIIPAPNVNGNVEKANYFYNDGDPANDFIFILFSNYQISDFESIYKSILCESGNARDRFRKFLTKNEEKLNIELASMCVVEGSPSIFENKEDGNYITPVIIKINRQE